MTSAGGVQNREARPSPRGERACQTFVVREVLCVAG